MREGFGVTVAAVAQAHSAYLETVLDMGIAGLVLLCAYFVHVWKGFRALSVDPAVSPTQRGFYQGAAAGLACFMVTGITGGFLTPADYQVFLWLAIGMMYGQRARKPAM
jgi:O-antigen ligase